MGLTKSQRNLLRTPNPLSKRPGSLSNVPLPILSAPRRAIGAIGRSVGVTGRTVGPGDLLPDTEVDYFERDDFDDFWTKTSTTDFDIVGSPVYEGTRALQVGDGSEWSAVSNTDEGLPYYPDIGDRIWWRVQLKHSNSVPSFEIRNPATASGDRYEGFGVGLHSRDDMFVVTDGWGDSSPISTSFDAWETDTWYLVDMNSRWDGDDVEYFVRVFDGPTHNDPELISLGPDTFDPGFGEGDEGIIIHDHRDGEQSVYDRIVADPDGAVFD